LARLVEERPSRGFWKCSDQLRKKRPDWNPKRIYRVHKAMKLNLRRAAKRRLPKRERVPLNVPRHPDTVWSMDFMSDALACGKRIRTFNVVDDFNREVLHIEVDTSLNSGRLVRVFEQLKRDHGLPQVLRSDNGPEFLGEAFTQWAKLSGVAWRCDTSNLASPTRTPSSNASTALSVRWCWTSTSSHALRAYVRQRIGG